jgi:hypothetical protein
LKARETPKYSLLRLCQCVGNHGNTRLDHVDSERKDIERNKGRELGFLEINGDTNNLIMRHHCDNRLPFHKINTTNTVHASWA